MPNHLINNYESLAVTPLREDALAIAEAGYRAINVAHALAHKLRVIDDTLFVGDTSYTLSHRRVYFVGIGKCANSVAAAIESLLGDRLKRGIALDVSNPASLSDRIESFVGTHPLPSETNVAATAHILSFLAERTPDDLVIMLISGGGSTLLCAPTPPMTWETERDLFHALTSRGASIQELNTVRKHVSRARGGGLAAACRAEMVSLIVSDVPGNDIEFIASGPTILDSSSVSHAQAVLEHYHIPIDEHCVFLETPKDGSVFERVTNTLFLTNDDALTAMHREATTLGYTATIVTTTLSGEARDVAHTLAESLHRAPAGSVLLYGGETTVTVADAAGTGGRNQELALAALRDIHDDELILPLASDGHDNTDHAGAIADATARTHAEATQLSIDDALTAHCSYDFFSTTGDALDIGYTGSNVSDIIITMKSL